MGGRGGTEKAGICTPVRTGGKKGSPSHGLVISHNPCPLFSFPCISGGAARALPSQGKGPGKVFPLRLGCHFGKRCSCVRDQRWLAIGARVTASVRYHTPCGGWLQGSRRPRPRNERAGSCGMVLGECPHLFSFGFIYLMPTSARTCSQFLSLLNCQLKQQPSHLPA